MIYKFKSKASGDVIMLGPHGDELLRLIGREPAPQGIFDVADIPAVLATLQAAVQAAEATEGAARAPQDAAFDPPHDGPPVGLRQRAWPLVELLRRSGDAGVPVVWGV